MPFAIRNDPELSSKIQNSLNFSCRLLQGNSWLPLTHNGTESVLLFWAVCDTIKTFPRIIQHLYFLSWARSFNSTALKRCRNHRITMLLPNEMRRSLHRYSSRDRTWRKIPTCVYLDVAYITFCKFGSSKLIFPAVWSKKSCSNWTRFQQIILTNLLGWGSELNEANRSSGNTSTSDKKLRTTK